MTQIQYRGGYKYSLWETYVGYVRIKGFTVRHRLFELDPDGKLTIFENYPWDGASGPTIDTKSSMRGSVVHDALYEMMRLGLLPQSCFELANEELRDTCKEDGMWHWRADGWYDAVEKCGHPSADVCDEKILFAP